MDDTHSTLSDKFEEQPWHLFPVKLGAQGQLAVIRGSWAFVRDECAPRQLGYPKASFWLLDSPPPPKPPPCLRRPTPKMC